MDVVEDVLLQLQSTLDDDLSDTRLLTCRVLRRLLTLVGRSVDQDRLHNLYPCLLKRLDDSNDDVRRAATETFSAYMQCFGDDYNVAMYRAHIDAIYHGLLVHLDDQDSAIQLSVLGKYIFSYWCFCSAQLRYYELINDAFFSTASQARFPSKRNRKRNILKIP